MPRDPKVAATKRLEVAQANDKKARLAVKRTRAAVVRAVRGAYSAGLTPTETGKVLGLTRQGVNDIWKRGK